MPIRIRPLMMPGRELDVMGALTAAVAHELWKACGGNEVVNWIEAERLVGALVIKRAVRRSVGGRHAAEREQPRRRAGHRADGERVTGCLGSRKLPT